MRKHLSRYRDTLRKLERRSDEARRWREMASRASGSVVTIGNGSPGQRGNDIGGMLATAEGIHQECDELAALAGSYRAELRAALALLPNPRHRDLLEAVYIDGKTVERIAGELNRSAKTVANQIGLAVIELRRRADYF